MCMDVISVQEFCCVTAAKWSAYKNIVSYLLCNYLYYANEERSILQRERWALNDHAFIIICQTFIFLLIIYYCFHFPFSFLFRRTCCQCGFSDACVGFACDRPVVSLPLNCCISCLRLLYSVCVWWTNKGHVERVKMLECFREAQRMLDNSGKYPPHPPALLISSATTANHDDTFAHVLGGPIKHYIAQPKYLLTFS